MTGPGDRARCFAETDSLEEKGKQSVRKEIDELPNTISCLRGQRSEHYSDEAQFLERVLDSLTHPFYVIDAESYRVTLANESARNSFRSFGTTCHSLTHGRDIPCDTADHQCPLEEVKKTRLPVMVEHIHYDAHGQARHMEVHGYPILDSAGRVVQMIEYNLDVTERTNAKLTLQTTNQRATLYLDILSHDISNQLQIILFSKEFLQNLNISRDMGAHFQHLLALINESAQKCRKIISKVIITEKLMSVPLFERRLDVVLKECIKSLMKEHRGAMIDVEIEVTECWILADEFLEHVFMNLLENALLHNSAKNKRIWVHLLRKENEYEVSISDNGEGIPESLKQSLFDMSRRSGGIGLDRSQHIVQKYGGRIEVYDRVSGKPRMGTGFLIKLPETQKRL